MAVSVAATGSIGLVTWSKSSWCQHAWRFRAGGQLWPDTDPPLPNGDPNPPQGQGNAFLLTEFFNENTIDARLFIDPCEHTLRQEASGVWGVENPADGPVGVRFIPAGSAGLGNPVADFPYSEDPILFEFTGLDWNVEQPPLYLYPNFWAYPNLLQGYMPRQTWDLSINPGAILVSVEVQ